MYCCNFILNLNTKLMNRNQLSVVAMGMVLFVCLLCCKKKTPTPTYDVSHMTQLFAPLKPAPQTLSVQAGRDTTIFGHDSTALHFFTNSFKDANSNPITSGTIDIQLTEMYKPGDMVANRASSIAGEHTLQSGGQVNIIATMLGRAVFTNKYSIGFKQPGTSGETMSLYYGGNTNADSITTWTVSDTTNGNAAYGTHHFDTGSAPPLATGFLFRGGYYYLFANCTQFGTINCDRLYVHNGDNTVIQVTVPDGSFNPTNTQIFVVFPTINSITMGDDRQIYTASTNTFIVGNHMDSVAVGMSYEVAVIANKNGSFYYFSQKGTTAKGMTINATMAPETSGDITARLAGL